MIVVEQEATVPTISIDSLCASDSPANSAIFHLYMAIAAAGAILVSLLMCEATSLGTHELRIRLCGWLFFIAVYCPLPAYWHEKRRAEMREAALALPWILLFALIVSVPVVAAAHSGSPLRDATFARIDGWLGVNVAAMAAWSRQHPIGMMLNRCYGSLQIFLAASIFIPTLTGRWRESREFLLANFVAICIGITIFWNLPAVGPWYGEHFAPTSSQTLCQQSLFLLRDQTSSPPNSAGIICFPSFHTVWSILCARALSRVRFLRWPAAIVAALIVVSTMTTGWHYFTDVVGGIILAVLSLVIASCLQTSKVCDLVAEQEENEFSGIGTILFRGSPQKD